MNETITPEAVNESSRHYVGWGVVAAAFTSVMVSFAPIVPYTFSLFLNPLHAAFGWKREAIGGTFALAAITVALVSPGIGLLLDRFPPRRIILPSILISRWRSLRSVDSDQTSSSSISHFLCWDWSPMELRSLRMRALCSRGFTSTEDSRSRWFSPAVELAQS
jgi:MFS family permease